MSERERDALSQRESWKNTILAGLANYIDAGSIVAGAAGLALWTELFHLSSDFVGLIGAFSSNAISAGVGALIGGWLCDQFGRKRIYQWDLLVYAFGILWIISMTYICFRGIEAQSVLSRFVRSSRTRLPSPPSKQLPVTVAGPPHVAMA